MHIIYSIIYKICQVNNTNLLDFNMADMLPCNNGESKRTILSHTVFTISKYITENITEKLMEMNDLHRYPINTYTG